MKLVLITGATKGLGIELANECLKNKYKVIGAARSKSKPLYHYKINLALILQFLKNLIFQKEIIIILLKK